jgi:hypothetical protein
MKDCVHNKSFEVSFFSIHWSHWKTMSYVAFKYKLWKKVMRLSTVSMTNEWMDALGVSHNNMALALDLQWSIVLDIHDGNNLSSPVLNPYIIFSMYDTVWNCSVHFSKGILNWVYTMPVLLYTNNWKAVSWYEWSDPG